MPPAVAATIPADFAEPERFHHPPTIRGTDAPLRAFEAGVPAVGHKSGNELSFAAPETPNLERRRARRGYERRLQGAQMASCATLRATAPMDRRVGRRTTAKGAARRVRLRGLRSPPEDGE